MDTRRIIPVLPAQAAGGSSCDGAESFALMVLGDSMLPEFEEGDIVVIEPAGVAQDGSFVLAFVDDEWTMRQLVKDGEAWQLRALNPAYAPRPIPDISVVGGVIIQKSKPGRRRAAKRYVE